MNLCRSRKKTACRATMASSIFVVAPRLLIMSATRSAWRTLPCLRIAVRRRFGELVGGLETCPRHARFAVDAEAKFHLVLGEFKARFADGRRSAGGKRYAHGRHGFHRSPADRGDVGECFFFGGRGPDEFVNEDGTREATRTGNGGSSVESDIVVDNDHFDSYAFRAGYFGGQTEVEAIARVVLDDKQSAGFSDDGTDRGDYGVSIQRSEDFPRHGRTEHAAADIASVRGLMTAAAAGDDRDMAFAGGVRIGANHDLVPGEAPDVRAQNGEALQHFFHHVVGMVDEFFHEILPPAFATVCKAA